jgi:2-polyprenyl-3-methyl-5-hydroxy-6-metoxy-1,4-benzoquinol methylase
MTKKISEEIESFASDIYIKDSTGENYIENIIHSKNLPILMSKLKNHKIDDPLLEMGFGEGTITEPLVRAGYMVEIIEGSATLCKKAEERFGNKISSVHCSYFESFKPPHLYSTVLSLHVLEHVDDPLEVIKNIYNWLKPGGICLAVVPNAESLHRQLAVELGLQEKIDTLSARDKVVGHQRVMTLKELVGYFEDAGFEVAEEFGYFLKIVPNNMMTTWKPELLEALTTFSKLPANLMANIGVLARRK